MSNAEQMIALYHRAFLICLALTILLLALSVILFVWFHIPELASERSGRFRRKRIREMERAVSRPEEKKGNGKRAASKREGGKVSSPGPAETAMLVPEETEMLGAAETAVLSPGKAAVYPPEAAAERPISFKVEKEIILIHTDEELQ